MPEKGYRIHLVGRISVQYYLIKYRGHYYLLDYADPKKFSSYGARGSSVRMTPKWTIYNVDTDKDKFCSIVNKHYITEKKDYKFVTVWLVLFFILLPFFNNPLLTHITTMHLFLSMSLIIGGFIAIVILLNIKDNPQIDISVYEKSFLESTNFKKMSMAITICLFLVIYILLFISMSLGVASGNLLVLLFLGCATSYYIILLRFIYFMLDRKVTGSRQMSGSFFGRCIRRYMKLGPLASMEPGDTYMLFKRVKE